VQDQGEGSGPVVDTVGEGRSARTGANRDAAAVRAERKKARLQQKAPDPDPDFDHLALEDLREMRARLTEEETRVSYWRRIVQARLDVLRTTEQGHDRVADLGVALADAQSSHRRLAHFSVEPVEGLPPLPDLAELWSRLLDPTDEHSMAVLEEQLSDAEHRLSEYRNELHRRLDRVTGELIARYRQEPLLALAALPVDPDNDPLRGHF